MSEKKNLLIVDGEEDIAGIIDVILESAGHRTSHEVNGATACDRIKAERSDLVIADIMMPGMDGFELCKRIRYDESMEAIIAVFAPTEAEITGLWATPVSPVLPNAKKRTGVSVSETPVESSLGGNSR